MAKGLVHYVVSNADVNLIVRSGLGQQVGRLPQAASEEYPCDGGEVPHCEQPRRHTICDLLVFLDGAKPYFIRDIPAGTGQAGTYNATAQKTNVG